MRLTTGRTMLGGVLALAALAMAPAAFAQQGQGSIAGRVTDKASGQPLASVQVTISAGTRGALSNADGRFVIENVTAGRGVGRGWLLLLRGAWTPAGRGARRVGENGIPPLVEPPLAS